MVNRVHGECEGFMENVKEGEPIQENSGGLVHRDPEAHLSGVK